MGSLRTRMRRQHKDLHVLNFEFVVSPKVYEARVGSAVLLSGNREGWGGEDGTLRSRAVNVKRGE